MPIPTRLRRLLPIVGGIGAAALLLTTSACSTGTAEAATAPTSAPRTVTSTATGKATGIPDNLMASVGVRTTGPTAAGVLADNNARTKALIDKVRASGVDDKDVQTTQVNLGPRYDDKGKIDGYQAENMLQVTFRDLATAGAHLDELVQVAGDSAQINSIQLGFNDDDALKSSARADAVKRARAQAEEMAKAAGAKVGRVRTITDVTTATPMYDESTRYSAAAADAAVPIAAGSRDLTIEVRVVFDLG